jgi:hypothetical protein
VILTQIVAASAVRSLDLTPQALASGER